MQPKEIVVDTELTRVEIGAHAPDADLRDEYGASVQLSQLWQEHPVVLAFVRHFG
jgi:peroxiredoxin